MYVCMYVIGMCYCLPASLEYGHLLRLFLDMTLARHHYVLLYTPNFKMTNIQICSNVLVTGTKVFRSIPSAHHGLIFHL